MKLFHFLLMIACWMTAFVILYGLHTYVDRGLRLKGSTTPTHRQLSKDFVPRTAGGVLIVWLVAAPLLLATRPVKVDKSDKKA